ncbi:MAG: VWA domain-containing protein [Caldilineaceae bacterium]
MLYTRKLLFFMIIGLAVLTVVIVRAWPQNLDCTKARNAIEISIVYAPEEDVYLQPAIHDFNCRFVEGVNPLTGAQLAMSEQPIYVTGRSGSSGIVHQGIINAVKGVDNSNVERPTIYSPAGSFWLTMVNYESGQTIFAPAQSHPTALTPVVIAIWESRLKALQAKHPNQLLGWEELLQVMKAPNGWQDYGLTGRKTVYYGHTNPYVSSTGLATLIAEFYASARYHTQQKDVKQLTVAMVNDDAVQAGVRDLENMIKHYAERTTEFKDYIAQGPDYVDFVALQEDDLLYINTGQAKVKPPEKLVALYPKEGTFWLEHPFAVPNADWVTPEQRSAARVFTDYVLSEAVQSKVMAAGLRPALKSLKLAFPFTTEMGVDPQQPTNVFDTPAPDVITAIQTSWQYVKKQADIALVIDTSGSMSGEKLQQAKAAANLFLDKLDAQNRVALLTFNNTVYQSGPLNPAENARPTLHETINSLAAGGGTALYDGILAAAQAVANDDQGRIRVVIVLSDGQDTSSQHPLRAVTTLPRGANNPLLIIPVAYGKDADLGVLNAIARFANTKVFTGDPQGITELFQTLSSYF